MASKRDLGEGNSDATDDEDPVKKKRCVDNIDFDNSTDLSLEGSEDVSQDPDLKTNEHQEMAISESNRGETGDLQSDKEVVDNVEGTNKEFNASTAGYCEKTKSYPTVELLESDQSSQHDSESGDSIQEFVGHCESHVETSESVSNFNQATVDSNQNTSSSMGSSNKESCEDSQQEVVFGGSETSRQVEVDSSDSNIEFVCVSSQGSTSKPYNSIDAAIDRVVKNYSYESINQKVRDSGSNLKEQEVIDISSDSEVTDISCRDQPKVIEDPSKVGRRNTPILTRIFPGLTKVDAGNSLLKAKNVLPIESHGTIVNFVQLEPSSAKYTELKLVPNPKVVKSVSTASLPIMVPIISKAPQSRPHIKISSLQPSPRPISESESKTATIHFGGTSNVSDGRSSTPHQPGAKMVKSIPAAVTTSSVDSRLGNLGDGCLISKLVSHKFTGSDWSDAMRANILRNGRLCPKLEMSKDDEPNQGPPWTSEYCYKTVPWLAGSSKINRFFCWPCLLYSSTSAYNWDPMAYSKAIFTVATDRHEITSEHLESCVRLKTYEMKMKMSKNVPTPHSHNELVRKNRNFFKLLVEVVCTVKKKINNMYTSHADCIELINLVSCYDGDLKDYLLEKSNTSKNSPADLVPSYVGGILASVEIQIRSKMESELNEAPFVCLILEDTSDVVDTSWIAVITRYVSESGDIRERFVKFVELSCERKPDNVIPIFDNIVSELNCGEKLVGFTYGGTFVEPSHTAVFNEKISSKYPSARFFHYKEHDLRKIICQALSHLKYTRGFFQCIFDLSTFFSCTPNAVKTFVTVDKDVFPDRPSPDVWDFASGFIITIKDHYASLVKFLMRIIAWPGDWTTEATVQAPYFLNFLRKVQNRFFVVLLAKIFSAVDALAEAMSDKIDMDEWKLLAKRATVSLFQIKNYGFDEIAEIACSHSLTKESASDANTVSSDIKGAVYRSTFNEIIDCVATVINCRNKGAELSFITLSTVSSIAEDDAVDIKNRVLDRLLASMQIDDITKLTAQINFYLRNKFFRDQSISQSIQCVQEFNLIHTMPDLHKFLQLLITVPMVSTDTYSNPTIKRVKTYVRGKTELNSVDALMWIEKEMVDKIQEDRQFYEDVIDIFVKHYGVTDSTYSKQIRPSA